MAAKSMFRTTELGLDPAGGTNYTAVADLRALMPTDLQRPAVDVTVATSANGYREFIAQSYRDGGEVNFRATLGKAQFVILKDEFDDDATVPAWRISFPLITGESTPSRLTFSGPITRLGIPERSTDDTEAWEVEGTIKITGKPVFAAGT